VLHAVAGPVDAATLLREARWVVEAHKLVQLEGRDDVALQRAFFHRAHAQRLLAEHGVDLARADAGRKCDLSVSGKVHLLLAAAPLVKLENVYKVLFENILGEKVSTAPVAETP
jgi:hypothetical protein